MADGCSELMRALAPDLESELTQRAYVLERVDALQPVGRRQLAARLNLPEREVRRIALLLRDQGLIAFGADGMTAMEQARPLIPAARDRSREALGLTALEDALCRRWNLPQAIVTAGDADADPQVTQEGARMAAHRLRGMLQSGVTLAVTGGETVAAIARALPVGVPMNVMVVSARGGAGRAVETQANTVAAEIARRLGGHHRLMHVPDAIGDDALRELRRLPEVAETLELLARADVLLHGVGRADEVSQARRLDAALRARILSSGAVAESCGCYLDGAGRPIHTFSSVPLSVGSLKPDCRLIAAAFGARKAEAISGALRARRHALLVTDEGAAKRMLALPD